MMVQENQIVSACRKVHLVSCCNAMYRKIACKHVKLEVYSCIGLHVTRRIVHQSNKLYILALRKYSMEEMCSFTKYVRNLGLIIMHIT